MGWAGPFPTIPAVATEALVPERAGELLARLEDNVHRVIVGKDTVVDLLITALLCEGHVLIEDVPGIGKTMLAKTLARSLGCDFQRIQFTPDLLPSDITGVSVFNQKSTDFEYRAGPIMAQIVLADEINRAGPRTQSALLEAMEVMPKGKSRTAMEGRVVALMLKLGVGEGEESSIV